MMLVLLVLRVGRPLDHFRCPLYGGVLILGIGYHANMLTCKHNIGTTISVLKMEGVLISEVQISEVQLYYV